MAGNRRKAKATVSAPTAAAEEAEAVPPNPAKQVKESGHPVFWVEVFDTSRTKWIPVDPLVAKTVGRAKFEPPGNDKANSMSYVVAFEEDNVARDVTHRYVKAFIAKTRKTRVDITPGGALWWRKTLRHFSRGWDLPRDRVEDNELARRAAQEPMPRNMQDFKDHPFYALERHLKRNEIIDPMNKVGTVTTGRASQNSSKTVEPVYRRRDVKALKSGDGWYRLGRDIIPGEQPLKRVPNRRAPRRAPSPPTEGGAPMIIDLDVDEDDDTTALYAEHQTTLYTPPPVVNGRVPTNGFGNLDLFVPSMVSPGGVHIREAEASKAARLLGVHYADAVTGFEFKARQGTAVITGAVVAQEYADAVTAVVQGFRDEEEEVKSRKKTLAALKHWRTFYKALRIRQRIGGYEIEGEGGDEQADVMEPEAASVASTGGGFIAEASPTQPQTAFDDDSDDSADSDVAWEEVGLDGAEADGPAGDQDLELVLDDPQTPSRTRTAPKSKPLTKEERQLRLQLHKMHLLCLLAHVEMRNDWCGDEQVQMALKRLLPSRVIAMLIPPPKTSVFEHPKLLRQGLHQASDVWRTRFTVTARGLRRCHWARDAAELRKWTLPPDVDDPLDLSDFRSLARRRSASRDVGAQLFCAMLRAVGVQARLLVSLQVLPLSGMGGVMPGPVVQDEVAMPQLDGGDERPARDEAGGAMFVLRAASPETVARERSLFDNGSSSEEEEEHVPHATAVETGEDGAHTERTSNDEHEQASGVSSELEKGSLLSADPSDEDAEPEWLV